MTRWRYQMIALPMTSTLEEVIAEMDKQGAMGWEVIQVQEVPVQQAFLIFMKRPILVKVH